MNKKGFTLVELLAVIAIIAVLSIIALPSVVGTFNESKKNSFISEARSAYKVAKQTWVMDPMKMSQEITYCEGSGCSGEALDLSGRNNFEYNIRIGTDGTVTYFYATDGTFETKYEGDVLLTDIVDAYEQAVEYLENNQFKGFNKFYLNSNNPLKLQDIVKTYEEVFERELNVTFGARPYRKREVMQTYDKRRKITGMVSKVFF